VPLWRIDLARVVSKYIGETEKNLDAVFEAAEASAAMLLFDEADALFGKRSEVQDAHDRYANLEIAYLLQRMETYDGVVVLSTNLLRHIDDAFARRLTFTLHFPFPDAALRRRLWRGAWPREAPLDVDADLDALGEEHALSGANITNAVLHAAHLAAAEGEVISNEHLQRGVDLERSKLGWIAPLEVVR
jgi:SpoVK/Ycf46/Vps4 family AAA+-type ATPase